MSRKKDRSRLDYQLLQPKRMLASLHMSGNTLTVIGTPGDDWVELAYHSINPDAYRFRRRVGDEIVQTVELGGRDIERLVFMGFGGDDYFQSYSFINLERSFLYGHDGNDRLRGASRNLETIVGGNGDDVLTSGGGSTPTGERRRLDGGPGNDIVVGGDTDDLLLGGAGDDQLFGNWGDDLLFGGEGDDIVWGDRVASSASGNDFLIGGPGNDQLHAGNPGFDSAPDEYEVIMGGEGDDLLTAGDESERFGYRPGFFRLYGGEGNDTFQTGLGDNWLIGQEGDDTFYTSFGDDFISGGEGDDRVNPSPENGNPGGSDRYFGGPGADNIRARGEQNIVYGGPDADIIEIISDLEPEEPNFIHGEGGDDHITGSEFDDIIFGGDGLNSLIGMEGDDVLRGGNDNDTLDGGEGRDSLVGQGGDDLLYGGEDRDILFGNGGNDGLFGGVDESDYLNGGNGSDRLLKLDEDSVGGVGADDAVLRFRNLSILDFSLSWNDAEIRALDVGFQALHEKAGSARILQDSVSSQPIVFIKRVDLDDIPLFVPIFAPRNFPLAFNDLIPFGNGWSRQINVRNWNENSESSNKLAASTIIHEIAHNWDSEFEIRAKSPTLANTWSDFLAMTDWATFDKSDDDFVYVKARPSREKFETVTTNWWYNETGEFALNYGRSRPQEDWATVWEGVFAEVGSNTYNVVHDKYTLVERFIENLF